MIKIAIIGAGMSALSAAHLLKDHAEITLFEKARGVGGRMSTRRAEPYRFDHGAQYFTARTEAFQTFIHPLIKSGLIHRWNARYVKFERDKIIKRKSWNDDEPRYVGTPGMNNVVKHLAKGFFLHSKTKISSLQRRAGLWNLSDEQGKVYRGYEWVISTAPSPQTAALLPESFKNHADIRQIEMQPCFSLMLGFSNRLPFEFEAAHVTRSDVSWIAVNSSKPERPKHCTLVVHSSESYAKMHLDCDRDTVRQHLCSEASLILGLDLNVADFQAVHGWHYANNTSRKPFPAFMDQDLKLAACGDWCQGGRVEGAFVSAANLVNVMKENVL
jgi:renalase